MIFIAVSTVLVALTILVVIIKAGVLKKPVNNEMLGLGFIVLILLSIILGVLVIVN